jgi:hypothetical protein
MQPKPYEELTDEELIQLCAWREARGTGALGMRAVCCVIRNRVNQRWLGDSTYHGVILHPYQFSSFNAPPRTHITDANESKWPSDTDVAGLLALEEAQDALSGEPDITNNAVFYFSKPITSPPREWGAVVPAASISSLVFWKPAPAELNLQGDV